MHDWFVTREALPGVWLINEPQHVCTWLVAGRERALLIDSGLGVCPIRPVAEALCGLPVDLVNTHYHFDHVGGDHEFDTIAVHEAGVAPLAAGTPAEILRAYTAFVAERDERFEPYRDLDTAYFELLTVDEIPRPYPAGFDLDGWAIPPARATRVLADGDVLDLGGRALIVLHTPGHSPDSISLLDERAGLLFAADQFNVGAVYAHFPDSDVAALARSARRLADLGDAVGLICVHHYPRVIGEPNLLEEFADAAERVADGGEPLEPAEDIVGNEIVAARFGRFSITVAGPVGPAASMHNPIG